MSRISPALRRRVRERAWSYCEYCRSFMDYTGHEFTVDHIIPESQGGTADFDNLCFCCFWCNNYKRAQTEFRDPLTGRDVRLFNPRKENWEKPLSMERHIHACDWTDGCGSRNRHCTAPQSTKSYQIPEGMGNRRTTSARRVTMDVNHR